METAIPVPTEINEEQVSQTLSKSQLKKRLQREKWLEGRGERRRIEKEKRKLKRQQLAKEREANGEQAIKKPGPKLMAESKNKFRVVIDMNFEDYMTESEISKAVLQVGRIYAINRHSENPCQLHISSLKGRILDKFATTNAGYQNWDINHSELDYVESFNQDQKSENKFVYLSGDAEDTLPDVEDILKDESTIFIIGGLVDHNRHKNLCYKMALERKIPTAKLPIKEHLTLNQRDILSTVAVFEIMLQVLGYHKSWSDALIASIPKRKVASQAPRAIKPVTGNESNSPERQDSVANDDKNGEPDKINRDNDH